MGKNGRPPQQSHEIFDSKSGRRMQTSLQQAVRLWPTPTTRDHKDTGDLKIPVNGMLGRAVHPSKTSGSLNPTWVEWLMGYPPEWTVCAPLEMPSSRKQPSKSLEK